MVNPKPNALNLPHHDDSAAWNSSLSVGVSPALMFDKSDAQTYIVVRLMFGEGDAAKVAFSLRRKLSSLLEEHVNAEIDKARAQVVSVLRAAADQIERKTP